MSVTVLDLDQFKVVRKTVQNENDECSKLHLQELYSFFVYFYFINN